jgi:hypothetical protein
MPLRQLMRIPSREPVPRPLEARPPLTRKANYREWLVIC